MTSALPVNAAKIQDIFLATDSSETSSSALDYAVELARARVPQLKCAKESVRYRATFPVEHPMHIAALAHRSRCDAPHHGRPSVHRKSQRQID
jgi:hypothetical protein